MKTEFRYWLVALMLGLGTSAWAQSAGTIQFGASNYTVAESAGSVTLAVQRSGSTNAAVSVDYATADGTATNGFKYTAVSGTLAFGPGETNKNIVVQILNESLVENTKTFRIVLSNPTGGVVLGARTNVTVSLTDNDVGIQLQFDTYSVVEDAGAVLISIVRGDDGVLPVMVNFSTSDLTAKNGVDYTGMTNTLSFALTEHLKIVSVPILNNKLKQPNRAFRVTLANPAGASLGSQRTATITILDNDQGFQFEFPSYSVTEDAGVALVTVLGGTDDTNSAVTVDCATSDGSATNGVDYLGITNTLAFVPGERVKPVAVRILNNGLKQVIRSFKVSLSNPTGGAVLGSATTLISILDNDPGVGFERGGYTNAWGSAGITVTVLRGNDWALEPITVDYATRDLTAKTGEDYEAASGTLEFQANETVKTLTIPLLRDRAAEGTKRFSVILTNVTGGATLGTASTTVFIVGAYFTVAPPFDTALGIRGNGTWNTLSWEGGGLLQRADRPGGPWQTFTNAKSPHTVRSPLATTFYRVTRPRPVNLFVPSSYDGQTPMPLVMLLHGYGHTGASQEDYMKFRPLAEGQGFLYCYPESTPGQTVSGWFWNATEACCDFDNTGIDDAGYLRAAIQEIGARFAVDQKRVFLIGHSTGGFMAYRMACQSADLIAGVASLAGVTSLNPTDCTPSEPVNILHIHGTADDTIPYAGSAFGLTGPPVMPPYPGAQQTVKRWAEYNGASGPLTEGAPSMDLILDVSGLDTVVTRYMNSPPGGAVELWTIQGGIHVPTLSSQFSALVIDWLLAHPKP